MRRIVSTAMILIALWAFALTTPVAAQPPTADAGTTDARALMTSALAAFEARQYGRAAQIFGQVFDLRRRCSILGNQAMALYRLGGHDREALDLTNRALEARDCELSGADRDGISAMAAAYLPDLRRRLTAADLRSADASVPAVVDASVDVATAADVSSRYPNSDGGPMIRTDAVVVVSDVPVLPPDLPTIGEEPPRTNRTAIALWGAAGGSLVVAGLFWGWYADAESQLNVATQAGGSTARWQRASSISLGTGLGFTLLGTALGIAGTVLCLVRPTQQTNAVQASPLVFRDGAGFGIGGTF